MTYRPTRRDDDGDIYYMKDILTKTPYHNKKNIDAKPAIYIDHSSYLFHFYDDEYTEPFVFKFKDPYLEYENEPYYMCSVISMDYDTDIYNIWLLELGLM